MSDLSPEAIIAEHHGEFDVHRMMYVCRCGEAWPALSDDYDREIALHAAHVVERLRDAGHTIVPTPTVEWFILKGGFFRQRGRIYSGPYVDREDAFRARNTIERIEDTHEYFIDSRPLAATASTAPEES